MDAWGLDPFDNDDACDFIGDLEQAPFPAAELRTALAARSEDGYLEAPDGSLAIAAAAVVAVRRAGGIPGVSDEFAARIGAVRLDADELSQLVEPAVAALEVVQGEDSELGDLWEEAGSLDAWKATLKPIERALRQ